MKSDQTASIELSQDPTKGKNSLDSSLVVIVKRLWMIVVSSAQALIHNQILYEETHISKVHTCTRMNSNLELQKWSLDVGIDVGSNIDLNAIAKDIYVVVDIYTRHNHSSKLVTTSAIKQYCNSLDTTLPSLTSCCTTTITSIMKSDQTASTELSRDPTKG